MISIEMLPAAHGDSLWIEYGSPSQTRRILIDGGPAHTYEAGLRKRIALQPKDKRNCELMVVTHIDADHIDGAIILLQDNDTNGLNLQIKEIWFNGWDQLSEFKGETFAPLQGEFLGGLLTLDSKLRPVWNRTFDKGPVVVPDTGLLPVIPLDGGAEITLLGPTPRDLRRLRARWASAMRDFSGDVEEAMRRLKERRDYKPPAGPAVFSAKQYGADRTPANGSSISFVLEHDGVSVLLVGDAHARTLATALGRLAVQKRSEGPLRFDAVKLPHHGSMGNVSAEWLRLVDCERWLISTNGAVFGHPDIETVELIAKSRKKKPTIFCNYRSDTTSRLEKYADWITVFPKKNESQEKASGLLLRLTGSDSSSLSRTRGGSVKPTRSAVSKKQTRSKKARAGSRK
jgi:beta-lactamase superfamily II metal-dependent hydrolase